MPSGKKEQWSHSSQSISSSVFHQLSTFLRCPRRLRQLRQSRVGTGSHPGHERLPDRHEAAEGAAEALQERQQTVLILALGSICSPC